MTAPATHPSLRVVHRIDETREIVTGAQRAGEVVGLVPTMGALHEGHLSLVDAARAECDLVVASIFVNPTQFAPHEDLARYPSNLERDLSLLRERKCDVVFVPQADAMYPRGFETTIDVGSVARTLEGAVRPTHFAGVATVVMKLFQLAPADRAYFGRKDYQQSLVIQQMVRDLNVPTRISVWPTVREPDGLAMSSRNAYLSASERARAVALFESLQLAERQVAEGERCVAHVRRAMEEHIDDAGGIELDYIAFVRDGTMQQVDQIDGPTTVLIAARIGSTRLIDNCLLAM